jgi:exonuclease SbcD
MKIAVLGDPHFGAGYALGKIDPYRQLNTRLLDHSNTFDHAIDQIADEGVSHLVVTGDIYEHRRPEASQIALFSEKLSRLADMGVHTHIVVGNHDLIRAHKTTTIDMLHQLKLPMVHVYSEVGSFHCEDASGSANLILFPFRTRYMLQCPTNEKAVEYLSSRLDYEMGSFEFPAPVILVGHFALQGSKSQDISLEKHALYEIVLPLDMFDDMDMVVMGHVHQFQVMRTDPLVVHLGSMERTDFGEARFGKYLMLITAEGSDLSYEFRPLPVRALHDITIDCTKCEGSAMAHVMTQLEDIASKRRMFGSIVRVEILIDEKDARNVSTDDVMRKLIKGMAVGNCVGVSTTVISHRQLRDSSITERLNPLEAFERYLKLIDDAETRDLMRQHGSRIINGAKA